MHVYVYTPFGFSKYTFCQYFQHYNFEKNKNVKWQKDMVRENLKLGLKGG